MLFLLYFGRKRPWKRDILGRAGYICRMRKKLLVLTGVGEAFPFMRIHTLLEASLFAERPVLVFYPGTFNDQQLRLFNCLKPNNYYRAFNVV